ARFHRQRGDEVFFLTGTDENAIRNDRAAKAEGVPTRQLVDRHAAEFRRMCDLWQISYDRFIRTTDPDHVAGVQEFVRRWIASDDIYLHTYEGLYCVGCEAFYEESDLVDGHCPIHGTSREIERVSEENYFFRLTKYAGRLKALYRDHPEFCVPEIRRNEVLGWLDRGLKDVSVSRRGLDWGIPFPDHPDHTVYVWFDALIRSSGNMIDPIAAAGEWGSDAARYLVLREAPFEKDSPISPESFNARFNADLANGLGNLVSRTMAMVERYFGGSIPDPGPVGPSERTVRDVAERVLRDHDEAASQLRFADALAEAFRLVDAANKHYTRTQPWQLAREPDRKGELGAALYAGCEALRLLAYLLWPYLPATAERIAEQLSAPSPASAPWQDVATWGVLAAGAQVRAGPALFPRLEPPKVA
ncbi:MAG: class I tRNA ligase family protein, partial [Chloroflexi bacterium]|nr:class I tRNA ligase family protein [Chloroflexota bacterium]